MAINNNAAADAFYDAIKSYLGWSPGDDDTQMRGAWRAGFGAFLDYLKANTDVLPDTLNNPAGQAVAVNTITGIGATTAPQVIAGTGKIQ